MVIPSTRPIKAGEGNKVIQQNVVKKGFTKQRPRGGKKTEEGEDGEQGEAPRGSRLPPSLPSQT